MYSDNRDNAYIREDQFMAAASGADGHTVVRLSDTPRVSTVVCGVICATVAVVCLSCFVFMLFLKPTHTASAIIVEGNNEIGNVSDQRAGITLPIYIPELDTRGSRIPVAITGTLKDGSEFSKDTYVSKDGSGLLLEPGEYELRVSGSPISSAGVIYRAPEESISITVTDDLSSSYTPDGFMSFSVIAAIDVTDEQIDEAIEFVKNDPERTQYAETIAEKARERRDEAIAASRAAQAAKEEAARVVAEQQLNASRNQQQEAASQVSQQNNQESSSSESESSSGNYNGNYNGNSGSGSSTDSGEGIYEEEDTSEGSGGESSSGGSGSGSSISEDGGQTSGSGSGSGSSSGSGSGSSSSSGGSTSGESGSSMSSRTSGGGSTSGAAVEVGETAGSQMVSVE